MLANKQYYWYSHY